jgi:hypothetical protein
MCELYEHRIPRNAVRYQFIAKTEKVLQTGRPEANPANYTVRPGESSLVCSLFNTFSSINLRTLLSFYFISDKLAGITARSLFILSGVVMAECA